MKRSKIPLALAALALLALTAVMSGCASQPKALTDPDIVGRITSVTGTLTSQTGTDMHYTVLIEGQRREGSQYDRASVTINDKTRTYVKTGDEAVEVSLLGTRLEGLGAQATFAGPVRESYPVQATADEMVLIPTESIEEVKDAHTDELMAIRGVVGVGIGESGGQKVIKVLLESDSEQLVARIPKSLGGYLVVAEVIGPITPQ